MSRKKTSQQRREQRKRAKIRLMESIMYKEGKNSLDCCQPAVCTSVTVPNSWIQFPCIEEKRNDMYNNASATIAVTAVKDNSLSYIKERLDRINWTKTLEIRDKFQSPYPKNLKEAKKWLAEGYIYFTGSSDEDDYCGWEWGKDTSKESRVAYDSLKKSYTDAYDTVSIVTDEAARLKTLQDFEAFAIA